jgi:preprotein translocase subunit YajC
VLEIIAQTPAPTTAPAASPIPFGPFVPIVLIIIVFYFIIIRPQQKQSKQRQNLLSALKVNDRVQTVGGLLASVVEVRDNKVRLKIDETNNVKAWYTRSAIHRIVEDDSKIDEK